MATVFSCFSSQIRLATGFATPPTTGRRQPPESVSVHSIDGVFRNMVSAGNKARLQRRSAPKDKI